MEPAVCSRVRYTLQRGPSSDSSRDVIVHSDRQRNVGKAIHCYHEALRVRRITSARLKSAALHDNLGNALLTLAEIEREREIRHARGALRQFDHAWQFYPRTGHPCDYAAAQLSRGQACMLLARQSSEENLQSAAFCLSEAREYFGFCEDSEVLQDLANRVG
jgi:hypothetical protein